MSYADDMIEQQMFESAVREMWEGPDITEHDVVRAYLYKRPIQQVLGDTREILSSLSPALKEGRLPATAQSIFIQGIAGRKLTEKQINALGLFVVRYGE